MRLKWMPAKAGCAFLTYLSRDFGSNIQQRCCVCYTEVGDSDLSTYVSVRAVNQPKDVCRWKIVCLVINQSLYIMGMIKGLSPLEKKRTYCTCIFLASEACKNFRMVCGEIKWGKNQQVGGALNTCVMSSYAASTPVTSIQTCSLALTSFPGEFS